MFTFVDYRTVRQWVASILEVRCHVGYSVSASFRQYRTGGSALWRENVAGLCAEHQGSVGHGVIEHRVAHGRQLLFHSVHHGCMALYAWAEGLEQFHGFSHAAAYDAEQSIGFGVRNMQYMRAKNLLLLCYCNHYCCSCVLQWYFLTS